MHQSSRMRPSAVRALTPNTSRRAPAKALRRGTKRAKAAFVHHGHTIQAMGQPQVVERNQERAARAFQFLGQNQHLECMPHIERRQRLVPELQGRLGRQRARDQHALPLAAGELVDRRCGEPRRSIRLKRLLDAAPIVPVGEAALADHRAHRRSRTQNAPPGAPTRSAGRAPQTRSRGSRAPAKIGCRPLPEAVPRRPAGASTCPSRSGRSSPTSEPGLRRRSTACRRPGTLHVHNLEGVHAWRRNSHRK